MVKGLVFVELLSMAEEAFGEEAVDDVIEAAALPSGGAYTAVGNYPCEELMSLVQGFSRHSGIPGAELQKLFGHWMMKSFVKHYPDFFVGRGGSLDMLSAIEDEIHVEVQKLYPEADLPHFDIDRTGANAMQMTYRSPRPLADFCHGLIEGCVGHFGETAVIARDDRSTAGKTEVDFRIKIDGPA
jgi:hypothetical protein